MLIIEAQKPDDTLNGNGGDLPPAYDALSIRQPTNRSENPHSGFSAFPDPVAGSSRHPPAPPAHLSPSVQDANKSLPQSPLKDTPSSPRSANPALAQSPRARKHSSWFTLLPFVSSFSAKRVRQSVLSIVSDLVVPPSRGSIKEQRNVHEILASVAETCAENKLSLSTILQETSIADHTPMYWAVVNYREELLVALLSHSQPLSVQAISDIRCACLVNSNQALFHALRVCHPPFHTTDGIQIPSLRTASENLLLDNRPSDEIWIQRSDDQGFVVAFDITLWQSRMRAIGHASVQFIVCGRMWSLTFFSTDPSSPVVATSGKSRKGKSAWYVMVSLLESSPSTFFDSQLVVDAPSPSIPEPIQTSKLREARSMTLPSMHDKQQLSRLSMYDYNFDGMADERLSRGHKAPTPSQGNRRASRPASRLPPPAHPLRGSLPSSRPSMEKPPSLSINIKAGSRKLGCRTRQGEPSKPMETLTTKPDTWSHHGVGYTSAVVTPFEESHASRLLCGNSQYLLPDGTLRGRLEARFIESATECIVC